MGLQTVHTILTERGCGDAKQEVQLQESRHTCSSRRKTLAMMMKRELPSSCTSESPPSLATVTLGRGPVRSGEDQGRQRAGDDGRVEDMVH